MLFYRRTSKLSYACNLKYLGYYRIDGSLALQTMAVVKMGRGFCDYDRTPN